MPTIQHIRSILLSSPYADADEPEIKCNFPNGPKRTIGMVEVALDNGVIGLGEGYLAVFAPRVFETIVELCTPYLLSKDAFEIDDRVCDLCSVCDYWSLQGAARHVTSAFEIAMVDAKAKTLGVAAHELLGGAPDESIRMYGSGGCCETKAHFRQELSMLDAMGIDLYKIRAVKQDILRTTWILEEAFKHGIEVGVDMCQNLAQPPQLVKDVVDYVERVYRLTDKRIVFLEEAIGPASPQGFKALRERVAPQVCGGEIITTSTEMIERIENDIYDFVQPDASVIGGIGAVMKIFNAAADKDTEVVVHAWGGPAALMANYHAAFAGNGKLVEYPMLAFPLREAMVGDQMRIEGGRLYRPTAPGIGVTLTPRIESQFPFDPTAVYNCQGIDYSSPPDEAWQ